MKGNAILEDEVKGDLTPMIDVVFLLLIFFMVTTTLIKQEADISIQLPSNTPGKPSNELPDKHWIDIMPNGEVRLNGSPTGDPIGADSLPELTQRLKALHKSSQGMGVKMIVTIQADPVSPHYMAINVLNSCAEAKLKFVSFAGGG